jgi:Tol biopolymer transport system component/DNA-binding winged helix-turn-helix (wHTH) protein
MNSDSDSGRAAGVLPRGRGRLRQQQFIGWGQGRMNERKHNGGADPASLRPWTAAPFRLGEWAVHPALNRVALGDTWVQVEPRVMHVLVCLASHPGKVFSREDLLEIVWTDIVVCEEALTRAISELRRVFRDDPRDSRFIETIRKGGYRLIAPVSPIIEPSAPAPSLAAGSIAEPSPDHAEPTEVANPPAAQDASQEPTRALGRPRVRAWVLAALAVLVVVTIAKVTQRTRSNAPPQPITLEGAPFTTYPGSERFPALSPDGTQVAFAWDGGHDGAFSIYVKQRNTESPLRLTDGTGDDTHPSWSPDGSTIAFIRRNGEEYAIHTVPSIGGVPRRLIALEEAPCGLDWSPDGAWLAFGCAREPGRAPEIMLLSLESLETRALTNPPAHYGGDGLPAFSPDGRSVAFTRADAALMERLYSVPIRGGEPRCLTPSQEAIAGIDWAADGRSLIFAAVSGGNSDLVRLALGSGAMTRLVTRGEEALRPSLSPAGQRLVYEELSYRADVYRIDLDASAQRATGPYPLIASTRMDTDACFSPDGSQLAFLSNRSGSREIWLCDADGGNPRQLTRMGGPRVASPCWSPDGRWLAFSADVSECFTIHVADVEGGRPRRIPSGNCHEIASLWSRDGQWIYYDAESDDGWDIRRVHPDGSGAMTVVTGGRQVMAESSDGRSIYHLAGRDSGIWRSSIIGELDESAANGESRALVVDGASVKSWSEIALGPTGAFFTRSNAEGCLLGFREFASGRTDSLLQLPRFCGGNLALSPDGRTLVYDHIDQVERDLMLVEGYR